MRMPRSRNCKPGGVMGALSVPLVLGVFAGPSQALAQPQHDHEEVQLTVPAEFPLLPAVLGPLSRPISTEAPAAQAYFDQGLQMIYSFTYPTAIASFIEAQRQDPDCAMCYFGEAWARGPFLNGGMQSSNAEPAFRAIRRATELAEGSGTPLERALIDAMSLRYTEVEDEARRPALDTLYARAMAEVYRVYPDDLDVGTLYAESLMLLNTNRGGYRLGDPSVQAFHGVLEAVLAKDITHPGACHLYIHATEATEEPGRAEACADLLGRGVPGSGHINHMPSHTYHGIGRWNSSVRVNMDAWHTDQKAAFNEGVSYAATHNLHMLLFAGSMGGQAAVSALAAQEYADQVAGGSFYEALVYLRFGWFDEILALDDTPEQPIQLGLYEFAKGYAHLRAGDPDFARVYLERVRVLAEETPSDVMIRGRHNAAQLLGITGDILEGELLREAGDLDGAIAMFRAAIEVEDGLAYDEPEPLTFSARHWLGAALLEVGRPAEAEEVYRASLVQHPHNGWSIYGLEQALRAQERHAEADEAHAWFREAWSQTDTMIRSSRF